MNTESTKEKFLELYLKNGFHVSNACKGVGINRTTYYYHLKSDPEFAQKVEEGKQEILDILIEEAEESHRMLRTGVAIRNNEGKFIGWEEKPDGRALEWFLTKRAKDKYGDVSEQNINIKGSIPIEKWINPEGQ